MAHLVKPRLGPAALGQQRPSSVTGDREEKRPRQGPVSALAVFHEPQERLLHHVLRVRIARDPSRVSKHAAPDVVESIAQVRFDLVGQHSPPAFSIGFPADLEPHEAPPSLERPRARPKSRSSRSRTALGLPTHGRPHPEDTLRFRQQSKANIPKRGKRTAKELLDPPRERITAAPQNRPKHSEPRHRSACCERTYHLRECDASQGNCWRHDVAADRLADENRQGRDDEQNAHDRSIRDKDLRTLQQLGGHARAHRRVRH